MKACIYYRVSTDRQDLDSQRLAIEEWIARLPAPPETLVMYSDTGRSGKDANRPGFKAMLEAAERGEIDTIIVYKLDRFSRDATRSIRLLLDLDQKGVAFISVTQPVLNLGHDNPFRRTMLSAFAEIAEIEHETIVARVKSGLAAAKARGVKLGRGYKISRHRQLLARRHHAAGLGYEQIASRMRVSVGTVHRLVTGPDIPENFGPQGVPSPRRETF